MRKNQPPAQLIMLFQRSVMAANGSSSTRNRIQRPSRKIALASLSSVGIVVSDWYQANVRFHTWLVKIRTIEASSAATDAGGTGLKLRSTSGRKDRMGTLWSTSRAGSRSRSAVRLVAASEPQPNVNRIDRREAPARRASDRRAAHRSRPA